MLDNKKPFKTWNQQLTILRKRGLEVPSNSKRSLEKIGYYTLINGYKNLFLARDSSGNIIKPEKFIDGSTFDEILALYEFDKKLRSILYDALLEYESNLAAEIAYRFSEKFPQENSYLAIYNFDSTDVSSVVRTISALSNTIKQKTSVKKYQQNAIKHYVNTHGHVPLWVLVNFLTFGELNYFYRICQKEIQVKIANDFTQNLRREYRKKYMTSVTPDMINTINHMVNHFRNAVAHNEITYSKQLSKAPTMRLIKKLLNLYSWRISSQSGIFELIICLKIVLPKKDYATLSKNIIDLLKKYESKFRSVSFEGILQDMNFPSNYSNFL